VRADDLAGQDPVPLSTKHPRDVMPGREAGARAVRWAML
jgi:hypothetical protein